MSCPLWRGETEWGIVLFFPRRPYTNNYAERLNRPSVSIFDENQFEALSNDEASCTSQEGGRHG